MAGAAAPGSIPGHVKRITKRQFAYTSYTLCRPPRASAIGVLRRPALHVPSRYGGRTGRRSLRMMIDMYVGDACSDAACIVMW